MMRRVGIEKPVMDRTNPVRLMLLLTTLAALFAMHGPSSNHMLNMPGRSATSRPAPSTDDMRGNAAGLATPPTATLVHGSHGSLEPVSSAQAAPDGGTVDRMNHEECLATTRSTPSLAVPPSNTAAAYDLVNVIATTGTPTAGRAPPQPSLTRLCVSRT